LRILIIDGDSQTALFLKKGLTENGFIVDATTRGDDGLHQATESEYNLIILDIQLPQLDGWQVLTTLRQKGILTPVIVLSSQSGVEDRVKGLYMGADDYLGKPFVFSELLARVRAILRRDPHKKQRSLQVADLEMDPARMTAKRAGTRLPLTPKEFDLLHLLMRRSGEVLSRKFIAEQVWDMNFDNSTEVVDVAISRLRTKVDEPFPNKLIRSIRGEGYILEAKK
jgi:two-component system, OmpR family, copper resistance phosphate regulon response regulator CusR